jgi:hypothetical protein
VNRPSTPPDPAKLLDAALDVFVYAPIGFLLDAREVVPKLAERGKGQVALARLFGRYAIARGQAEADRLINSNKPAASAPPAAPPSPAPPSPAPPSPAPPEPTAAATAAAATTAPSATKARPKPTPASRPVPLRKAKVAAKPAGASSLAIPGYDTLSASQVIPRLDALRPAELEAVRAYEAAHRGRRTILNRVAQLQA